MIASKIVKGILLSIGMALVFACVHADVIPDPNAHLVAYYPFNGNANDESGNGNHGSVFGDIVLTAGQSGNPKGAYRFDGEDTGIWVKPSASLNLANFSRGYTIAAWIKPQRTSSGYQNIISKQFSRPGFPPNMHAAFFLRLNQNRIEAGHANPDGTDIIFQSSKALAINTWYHVAMTWKNATPNVRSIYVNANKLPGRGGILKGLFTSGTDGGVSIGHLRLHEVVKWVFNGTLDEVRIYRSALSRAQIKQIMGKGVASIGVDTDGDCFADVWEKKQGYDPLDPNNPPNNDDDCMSDEQEKVTDTDGDGINDFWDNCDIKPNATVKGKVKGSCLRGRVGISCMANTDCGMGGVCSANQEDRDADGIGDVCDNCLSATNAEQKDADSDGVGDQCDNAPIVWNSGQEDRDADGVPDVVDNCPADPNKMEPYKPGGSMEWIKDGSAVDCALYAGLVSTAKDQWQMDYDCDGIGDVCDGNNLGKKPKAEYDPLTDDTDGDDKVDIDDNCPTVANDDQKNTDCDLNSNCDDVGDACDMDDDGDGIPDTCDADHPDNSPASDADGDGYIASCDPDDDADGVLDLCDADNNPDPALDPDNDGIINSCDNCPNDANGLAQAGIPDVGNQTDTDGNGVGDACEPTDRIVFELIDPDAPGYNYDNWEPKDGRRAQITANLYQNGSLVNPQPAIACTLVGNRTSSYPGRYHNDDPNNDPLYNSDPDYIVVSGAGTHTIVIESKDYGGYTVIRAETADGVYTAELKIPRDVDDDGLPDNFEKDSVLNPSRSLNPLLQDSDSNGDADTIEDQDTSVNQASGGDGLTAFAEYRGVMWNGQHHRLSPEKKNLFVYGTGFTPAFALDIGPAFENANLKVYKASDDTNEKTNLGVLEVTAYPDGYSAADKNAGHIRKFGTRKWDIPVLGESYFAYTDSSGYHYGQPTRIFVRSIEKYFNIDRPYLDEETLEGGTLSSPNWGNPNLMLDPLTINLEPVVEDQDDNGQPTKKKDKNKDGKLNGDYVEMDKATWNNPAKLSPFNIDNDDWVELPQDKGIPQTLVPNTKTAAKESTIQEVGRHVVTHEIGHAIGMGVGDAAIVDSQGHCLHDTNCLMFRYSIDWNRDGNFCPYHQSMIQIDNK